LKGAKVPVVKHVPLGGSEDRYDHNWRWYGFQEDSIQCDLPHIEMTMSDETFGKNVDISMDGQQIILNKVNTAVLLIYYTHCLPKSDIWVTQEQEDEDYVSVEADILTF
jgi:hypothetical protein